MSTLIQIAPKSASGVFGISDSAGVYTYYATLTLAMAAATSGQTIEMFADVTETGAVTVTLKNGVNINGNGHTYTLNIANATPAFFIPNSISNFRASIQNIIITRNNSTTTAGHCISIGINTAGILDLTGTIINNTGAGHGISGTANSDIQVNNATVYANSGIGINIVSGLQTGGAKNCIAYSTSGTAISNGNGKIVNCYGESTSNLGINTNNEAFNCTGRSGGTDGFQNSGRAFHCTGISTGGAGYYSINSGQNYNCTGYSTASNGFRTLGIGNHIISNCSGYSSAAVGMGLSGAIRANNCFAYSTVGAAFGGTSVDLFNCTGESLAAITVSQANNIYNCTLKCSWNNASGHVINATNLSLKEYFNNTLITTNASANAINSVNAQSLYIGSNVYKGMTTPLSANITQAQINTEDNFGNILIG